MPRRDARFLAACFSACAASLASAADAPQMTTTTRAPEPPPTTAAVSEPLPEAAPPATQPTRVDDRFSYAVGFDIGRSIRLRFQQDRRAADIGGVLKGVIDGLEGRDAAYAREEVDSAISLLQDRAKQQRAEQAYASDPAFRKRADDNLARSRAMLQQNANVAGVETLTEGVQAQVLKPGDGRVVGNAKYITAHVEVCLADSTLVCASGADKPERLATAQMMPALLDAMRGMKVGARWRIVVPSEKAYGLAGKPPVIGPNEALRYEVEVVDVE